jgi:hypothetical protein
MFVFEVTIFLICGDRGGGEFGSIRKTFNVAVKTYYDSHLTLALFLTRAQRNIFEYFSIQLIISRSTLRPLCAMGSTKLMSDCHI